VSKILLESGNTWLSGLTIKAQCQHLLAKAAHAHLPVVIPPAVQEAQFDAALQTLNIRHLAEERDGFYRAVESEKLLLRYYANSLPSALQTGV
jgi:hypothetical protein